MTDKRDGEFDERELEDLEDPGYLIERDDGAVLDLTQIRELV
jgi:hypothetical protein